MSEPSSPLPTLTQNELASLKARLSDLGTIEKRGGLTDRQRRGREEIEARIKTLEAK